MYAIRVPQQSNGPAPQQSKQNFQRLIRKKFNALKYSIKPPPVLASSGVQLLRAVCVGAVLRPPALLGARRVRLLVPVVERLGGRAEHSQVIITT